MVVANQGLIEAIFALADMLAVPSDAFNGLAALAVREVSGCDVASVSILQADGQLTTAGASDERTARLDQLQYHSPESPCRSAIRTANIVHVRDLVSDRRYPIFGPAAAALAVASCLSLPLTTSAHTVGSLNLYGQVPDAYDESAVATGEAVAGHASLLVASSRAHQRSLDLVDKQQVALDSRAEIEQAKGILMAGSHCKASQAFDILRLASQRENHKLRDIAHTIVINTSD